MTDPHWPEVMLYTVAFPNWSTADATRVESIRRQHDALRNDMILAHFTLVFGCQNVALPDYLAQIERVARQVEPISFACNTLKIEPTFQGDGHHIEWLADQGREALTELHLNLHTGPLQERQHPSLSFEPHITLATVPQLSEAQSLRDQWVLRQWSVQGVIDRLSVGQLQEQRFIVLADFPLRTPTGA